MKNKPFLTSINIFIALSVIVASLFLNTSVMAQTENEVIIPFSELGVTDIVLRGPYDSETISFSLPDNWQLLNGTAVELFVEVFIASEKRPSTQSDEFAGALLNVYFNRRLQQSISLVTGEERLYRIPIRVQDLDTESSDGRVQITFFLDSGIDCEFGFHKTTVKISPDSTVSIAHAERSIDLDLRNLPRPIYKRDAYIPEVAKVVISDTASADELQAAYLVMTAFGRMTNRRLDLSLLTNEQLNQPVQENAHLIFVGKASSFPVLDQLQMPIPIEDGAFDTQMLQPEDGLIQMFVSPWNSNRVVLVVGGNTDLGVVKASQALTTGNLQTSTLPTVSFIAEVVPLSRQLDLGDGLEANPVLDFTLADLGYSIQQTGIGGVGAQIGFGTQWFSYEINVPVGRYVDEQAYFDLVFSRSSLVDPDRSEINLFVNGTLAGSAPFEAEQTSFIKKRIDIPPTLFQPGRNQLDLAVDLFPFDACTTLNLNGLWMSIYPDSSLHLPLTGSLAERTPLIELRNYPIPFLANPTLSDLRVIVSQNDVDTWISLSEMVYDLGGQAAGEVISFEVSFSETLSENERQNNMILFGVPMAVVLDEELNTAMPAPFEQNSNVAVLEDQTVIYRIEPTKSLGYLELFSSPWNEEKIVLAVLGTNEEGLSYAKDALIDSSIRSDLNGNFATLDGEQYAIVDTRSGLGLGSFPAVVGPDVVEETVTTPETGFEQGQTPNYEPTRQNILIVLGVVLGAILVIIVIALAFRQRNVSNR